MKQHRDVNIVSEPSMPEIVLVTVRYLSVIVSFADGATRIYRTDEYEDMEKARSPNRRRRKVIKNVST